MATSFIAMGFFVYLTYEIVLACCHTDFSNLAFKKNAPGIANYKNHSTLLTTPL